MNKVFSILILIGCIIQIYFHGKATASFAHFHIDWVCERGNNLLNEKHNEEEIADFNELCEKTEKHYRQITYASIKAFFINGAISLFFIGLSIVFIILNFKRPKHEKK